ncbi:MAG: TA system VapC family ribonuclease toxin [Verrucomicrobiota bacterium]
MSASLFDSNAWVALTFANHPHHSKAKAALGLCSPDQPAVFCRATEQSYLRLITTPKLIAHYRADGMTNSRAVKNLADFLGQPRIVSWPDEPSGTRDLWLKFAFGDTPSPKVWMDAYLAAFAISAKLTFTTLDADFVAYKSHGLDLHLLTDH